MQEADKIINSNSPLYKEFALDELPPDLIEESTFDDDYSPYTFDSTGFCDSSSLNSITIDPCDISKNKDIETSIKHQGRLLKIRVLIKGVCPNKKIAVGVLLLDKGHIVKGFKVKKICVPPPPTSHPGEDCAPVVMCDFCFVLPSRTCSSLTLTAKVIAHYTDFYLSGINY